MESLIAEFGVAFGFVLIVVLAIIVAVVGLFGLFVKVLGAMGRVLFGGVSGRAALGGARVCRDPACGHENPANAVFCGQCGRRLL